MRRNPGVGNSPSAVAHAMRRHLVGDPFVAGPWQWGVIDAVHGSFSSSLSAGAAVGDTTLSLGAAPAVNSLLLLGSNPPLGVESVSGSAAPYTATLKTEVAVAEASATAVTDMKTADIYLDGTQTLNNTDYLTVGLRWLVSYTPAVGDVVIVARGTGGLRSDRLILGTVAV